MIFVVVAKFRRNGAANANLPLSLRRGDRRPRRAQGSMLLERKRPAPAYLRANAWTNLRPSAVDTARPQPQRLWSGKPFSPRKRERESRPGLWAAVVAGVAQRATLSRPRMHGRGADWGLRPAHRTGGRVSDTARSTGSAGPDPAPSGPPLAADERRSAALQSVLRRAEKFVALARAAMGIAASLRSIAN
jgi:hypothetical protein